MSTTTKYGYFLVEKSALSRAKDSDQILHTATFEPRLDCFIPPEKAYFRLKITDIFLISS